MDFFICSNPSLGSAAQIVTAFAAVVAASTGLYGVLNAVRTYRTSVAAHERQATNERRDQARFVHPTFTGVSTRVGDGNLLNDGVVHPELKNRLLKTAPSGGQIVTEDVLCLGVVVDNASEEVISQVHIGLDGGEDGPDLSAAGANVRYVLPKTKHKVTLVFPWKATDDFSTAASKVTIFFTDGRGNIWSRATGEPVADFTNSH